MWVFPSGDVHLLKSPDAPTTTLRVFVLLGAGWRDASTVGALTVGARNTDPPIVDPGVSHAITGFTGSTTGPAASITVTPSATTGRSFHAVEARAGGQSIDHGIIRITTHDDVSGLFSGDRSLSIFSDESDRVISVFAQFTDRPLGAIEDVTGHSWLRYEVAHPSLATISSEGRIRALASGNTTIEVSLWDRRFRFTVSLTIRPSLAFGPGAGMMSEQLALLRAGCDRNVYVLAEGYIDQSRFFNHARKAVKAWLESEPYKKLAHRFNVVGIFQASADRGLTIAPPLIPAPAGSATHQRALWKGGSAALPTEFAIARDTVFGLMAGGRLSTPVLATEDPKKAKTPAERFATPRVQLPSISPDVRRLPRFGTDHASSFDINPPHLAFADLVGRYISAARHPFTSNDRVVFLVDDDLQVGETFPVLGLRSNQLSMVALSIGDSSLISNVVASGRLLDRTINDAKYNDQYTGSVFAHELAHTYRLGDEYENARRRSYSERFDDDDYENLQHDASLHLRVGSVDDPNPLRGDNAVTPNISASKLDVTKIKWNIHRIAKISIVVQLDAIGHRVTLAARQAARWKLGERAFLRNRLTVQRDLSSQRRVSMIEIHVISVDPALEEVRFSISSSADLASLGEQPPLLYVPVQNKSHIDLSLIDPAVLAHLKDKGPFPKGQSCLEVNSSEWNKDRACPEITGFKRPSPHANAIGLYEGGGDISCDIYRPAGRCKMRTIVQYGEVPKRRLRSMPSLPELGGSDKLVFNVVEFCFVCKYVLIDLIDPTQHESLDKDYPKDC